MKTPRASLVLLAFLFLAASQPAAAHWSADPTVNVPVCALPANQGAPLIVSDGAGGVVIVWGDGRSSSVDQYALRLQATGDADPAWPATGQALCLAPFNQYNDFPQRNGAIVSDGAGGAIVCWQDKRKGNANIDIYAQHVLGSGEVDPFWPPDGCAVSAAEGGVKEYPVITSDGVGGAFIAWQDSRNEGDHDLYVQRVLSTGTVDTRWPAHGLAVAVAPHLQVSARIVSDGSGGAIVCWGDRRSITSIDIYGQRLNAAGIPQWTPNGHPIWIGTGDAQDIAILADGVGGAIITWSTHLNPSYDIYAQRVSHSGLLLWGAQGAPVCTEPGSQYNPAIAPDGSGGAIIVWDEGYVRAQRLAGDGSIQWDPAGVLVCSVPNHGVHPTIVPDGIGGAIIGWGDTPNDVETDPDPDFDINNVDIYAQHVLAGGIVDPVWPTDGRAICTAPDAQYYPVAAVDGSGGAIFAWVDNRVKSYDVYAQRVDHAGRLGTPFVSVPTEAMSALAIESATPNPAPHGRTTLTFVLPTSAEARLECFDTTGRRVPGTSRTIFGAGRHRAELSDRPMAPGVYLIRLSQGQDSHSRRVVVLE